MSRPLVLFLFFTLFQFFPSSSLHTEHVELHFPFLFISTLSVLGCPLYSPLLFLSQLPGSRMIICTMPPRSSLTSSFSVTDANNEVVCPLKNNDSSNCRKRCLGVSTRPQAPPITGVRELYPCNSGVPT